ncbi:MAG: hypothetical protein ACOZNI_09850 [Myxococcota bacterium]
MAFLLASPAFAQDMFAGFDDFCGLPVVVGADPQTATARKDAYGRPYIHVDPGVMANWTMSRRFTLAHECAHHLLGHTSSLGELARYSGGTRTQELEADCWAAAALSQAGYASDISRTVLQNASQGHFTSGGYPSGDERARNILTCSSGRGGNESCENISRPCRHAAHSAGDAIPCTHLTAAHPLGDLWPCQHACASPYGYIPCHSQGDLMPCEHTATAHAADSTTCSHPAHPAGDIEQVCR